ncbi:GNAT family N-acetyltransferase [Chloroflexota bacterium]
MELNSKSALQTVKKVLAADFACDESDFDKDGVFINQAQEMPGRRKLPFREKQLNIATLGKGVVISCSAERLEWAKENLGKLSKDDIFNTSTMSLISEYISPDNQTVGGTDLKYICIPDRFRPYAPGNDVKLTALDYKEIKQYFETQEFSYAIGKRDNPDHLHQIAVSAVCDGKIAGIGAASEDCEEMYQVGIHVLPEYRDKGIGRALVSKVTEKIFEKGRLSYYSTWASNLASRRLNISLGYFPAWIELYVKDKGER